jgi:predicted RNA-binding protein associated with RNAse of E/G family
VTHPLTVRYESGDVLIADAGYSWLQVAFKEQFFWATAMFDAKGEFMQGYFDITAGNTFENMENPKFQDMYLDLVLLNDGGIQVLDRDELDEAFEQKEITEEQYRKTIKEGETLYWFLQENKEDLVKICVELREKLLHEEE